MSERPLSYVLFSYKSKAGKTILVAENTEDVDAVAGLRIAYAMLLAWKAPGLTQIGTYALVPDAVPDPAPTEDLRPDIGPGLLGAGIELAVRTTVKK